MTQTTASQPLTAVLLQISELAQQVAGLDRRQEAAARDLSERLDTLAPLAGDLAALRGEHAQAVTAIADLGQQVTDLTASRGGADADGGGKEEEEGYRPVPAPALWKPDDPGLEEAVTRLRAWVSQVYRPGYGHLAAALPACWDQHPLCLYLLDWLSELWSVLYLQPGRTPATLAGQAEWHTRLLPAAAALMTAEARRCHHDTDRDRAAWTGARP
ncbi:MAG: hypothetical protein M0030_26735 [Actinomycetota bacterium]|nr:hypothetical protein [Actinomycetota bacterium]